MEYQDHEGRNELVLTGMHGVYGRKKPTKYNLPPLVFGVVTVGEILFYLAGGGRGKDVTKNKQPHEDHPDQIFGTNALGVEGRGGE